MARREYRRVKIKEGKIIKFIEKIQDCGAGNINAGIYFVSKKLWQKVKCDKVFSFKKDVLDKDISMQEKLFHLLGYLAGSRVVCADHYEKKAIDYYLEKSTYLNVLQNHVTDEEVEADLQQQRENSARSISVEDRPVKDSDETIINLEGFVD